MREKVEEFSIQSRISVRHSHDLHRVNEPRVWDFGMGSFRYGAQRLFDNLLMSIKDSDNASEFKL